MNSGVISRKKRFSEPRMNEDTGHIFVTTNDGRYLRKILGGRLQIPTAIVTIPAIGRICYADAGLEAKIECADMDGLHRTVVARDLVYSPTSMTVDEGKDNRIYWADPKYHKVDSCLPDDTHNLYVQDKFGRGRVYVLESALNDVHSVRIQQRFARDILRAVSPCARGTCSHFCVPLPGDNFKCLCPMNSTIEGDGNSCSAPKLDELPLPKQCKCQNGGKCLIGGTCVCNDNAEGEFCQKSSSVSRKLIGRLGSGGMFAMIMMLIFLLCLGTLAFLAVTMYRRKLLLFKKNEAADGAVSFNGNVISFSNPVLDSKHQSNNDERGEIEYNMSQMASTSAPPVKTTTTTFANPVYELDSDGAGPSHVKATVISEDGTPMPETAAAVIAPRSELLKPVIPPRKDKSDKPKDDKAELVFDQVSDV
uniref:EGF-like domain-containing protein n=1 Tax=Panagrolaimus sp. ES5 TaxID=591445 RepID=A0AC34G459_9BILA